MEEVVGLGENAVSALLLRWRWGLAHSIYWSGIGGPVISNFVKVVLKKQ